MSVSQRSPLLMLLSLQVRFHLPMEGYTIHLLTGDAILQERSGVSTAPQRRSKQEKRHYNSSWSGGKKKVSHSFDSLIFIKAHVRLTPDHRHTWLAKCSALLWSLAESG